MKKCGFYLNAEGVKTKITSQYTDTLNNKLKDFAEETFRTLLLAYSEVDNCS